MHMMLIMMINISNLAKTGCGAGQHLLEQPDSATIVCHRSSAEEEEEAQMYHGTSLQLFSPSSPYVQKSVTNLRTHAPQPSLLMPDCTVNS